MRKTRKRQTHGTILQKYGARRLDSRFVQSGATHFRLNIGCGQADRCELFAMQFPRQTCFNWFHRVHYKQSICIQICIHCGLFGRGRQDDGPPLSQGQCQRTPTSYIVSSWINCWMSTTDVLTQYTSLLRAISSSVDRTICKLSSGTGPQAGQACLLGGVFA